MIAPDLPLEPAPRNDFSRTTTRPARRLDSAQAMLAPMTPPPTTITSAVCAIKLLLLPTAGRSRRPVFRRGRAARLRFQPSERLFPAHFLGRDGQVIVGAGRTINLPSGFSDAWPGVIDEQIRRGSQRRCRCETTVF